VARVEWAKMDAAMSERQAHPKGQQVTWMGTLASWAAAVIMRVWWVAMDSATFAFRARAARVFMVMIVTQHCSTRLDCLGTAVMVCTT
jgi:hypothetical protein